VASRGSQGVRKPIKARGQEAFDTNVLFVYYATWRATSSTPTYTTGDGMFCTTVSRSLTSTNEFFGV
jgi:hypothetical protein